MLHRKLKSHYYSFPYKYFGGKALPCRNLFIELTYRCNLLCEMCFIMNEISVREDKTSAAELQKDEILNIVNQLPTRSNITFTGGEILLKKDIDIILSETASKHNVNLASNGALLGKYAELIVESGIQSIGISLDGPPEIHEKIRNQEGLFGKIKESLCAVIEAKNRKGSRFPYINFNSVILNKNYLTLSEVVKIVKDMGADSCSFQIFDPSLERSGLGLGNTLNYAKTPIKRVEMIHSIALRKALLQVLKEGQRRHFEILFVPALSIEEIVLFYQGQFNLKNWQCHLPWTTMRISPYGDVYPCLNYYIGNVRTDSLAKLWNNHRYVSFRRALKQNGVFNGCTGCCKMHPKK